MLFGKLVKLFKFKGKREQIPLKYIIENVPYFSQWESPLLVKKIIKDEISAKSDPLWRGSGAKSPAEYEFWAKNMCGMACLKMVISHKFNKKFPIIKLGRMCLKYGGYVIKQDAIDGLFYQPFTKFVKKEFDLNTKIFRLMSINDIINEISFGNYVIASVSHKIRDLDSYAIKKGGHLILILGYNLKSKKIFFHNPSGDKTVNQKYAGVSFLQFNKFFAEKGIVIES